MPAAAFRAAVGFALVPPTEPELRATWALTSRPMLSEAAEFLLGALYDLQEGLCPACAANMMGCTREDMVKATKELIVDLKVFAGMAFCSSCQRVTPVARLRQPRF